MNKVLSYLKHIPKVLIILFLFSLIVRSLFITKEMPFILHPDEPTIINSTLNLSYELNPKHFDWPHFYYYVNYIFFSVLFLIERVSNRLGYPNPSIVATENFYLLSRFITVIFGSLSVVYMYKLTENITKNKDIALISGLILAILPFHITRSAQALTDVPMVFFLILSLYFLSKNLDSFDWRNVYISSFLVGLAVSTKYNAYMIAVSLILFVFIIRKFNLKDLKNYFYCFGLGVFGFLVGTPYALFDFKTFIRDDGPKGALWQFKNVGSVDIVEQVPYFFNNLTINLLPDFAFIPWILSLVFIVWFFYQNKFKIKGNSDKFILILIIQFLFIIWSVSGVKIQRSHYFMAVYALVPVFVSLITYKNFKLMVGSVFITSILSLVLLSESLLNNSRIEFYERVVFENEKKNYNILYSDSQLEPVLRKLEVDRDEFDPGMMDFNSRFYTHILSSQNLCPGLEKEKCSYLLVDSVLGRHKGDDLYIYEIKKN